MNDVWKRKKNKTTEFSRKLALIMNRPIAIILCFIFLSCSGQKSCRDFKVGKFRLTSEVGTSIIERKENQQIETIDGINYYSDVEWIDDCTYLLKNLRNHNKELEKEEMGNVYRVEILRIFKDSIKIRTTTNYADFVTERTLDILELNN